MTPMSSNTMSYALPESLREYIDERVRSGQYGNTSEYLRHLIRRDKDDQAKQHSRELITEGLASGPARPLSPRVITDLREKAFRPTSRSRFGSARELRLTWWKTQSNSEPLAMTR